MADKSLPALLVTNDDGIEAVGLRSLVSAIASAGIARVFVCAPDVERSAISHAVTVHGALEANLVEDVEGAERAYSLSGTPADCVAVGISGDLFSQLKPILVLSGINKGSNVGLHVIYSGTVGAAREALMAGVPSLALSLDWSRDSVDGAFSAAASALLPLIASSISAAVKGTFPSSSYLLNINAPLHPSSNKGIRVVKPGLSRASSKWVPFVKRRTGVQLAFGSPMMMMGGRGGGVGGRGGRGGGGGLVPLQPWAPSSLRLALPLLPRGQSGFRAFSLRKRGWRRGRGRALMPSTSSTSTFNMATLRRKKATERM